MVAKRCAAFCLLVFVLVHSGAVGAEERSPSDLRALVGKAIEADTQTARQEALRRISEIADRDLVAMVLRHADGLQDEVVKVQREQAKFQAQCEEAWSKKVKADRRFQGSSQSGRDMEQYNRVVKKISRKLGDLRARLRSLEEQHLSLRLRDDRVVLAMATALESLPQVELKEALGSVDSRWLGGSDIDLNLLWISVMAHSLLLGRELSALPRCHDSSSGSIALIGGVHQIRGSSEVPLGGGASNFTPSRPLVSPVGLSRRAKRAVLRRPVDPVDSRGSRRSHPPVLRRAARR